MLQWKKNYNGPIFCVLFILVYTNYVLMQSI